LEAYKYDRFEDEGTTPRTKTLNFSGQKLKRVRVVYTNQRNTQMSSFTVFEWSVGMGAWLSLAAAPLLLGIESAPLFYTLTVGVPLIMISLLYVAASLSLAFLHLQFVVLWLMVREDVVVGLFTLLTIAAIVGTAAKLLEEFRTNPESLSPRVRSVVLRLSTGLSYAQQQALRLSNRLRIGRERFLANPSTVQGVLAFLGSLLTPWSPVTLVSPGVPQETEGLTAAAPPTEASLVGEAVRQEAVASESPSLSSTLNDAFLHED